MGRSTTKTRTLWDAIQNEFLVQEPPMTVRQVFYRMSSMGVVDKTEAGYRRVQRALVAMRREGAVPYGWIADNSRQVHAVSTWDSVSAILRAAAQGYARDLWKTQLERVHLWIEKDALAGVIRKVTDNYRVPLYVARGYSSLSYLHDAAGDIRAAGRPVVIYHLSDFDASGKDAARAIRESLRDDFDLSEFTFHELAVTAEQVEEWDLQTRPAKESDPRSKNWGSVAVELDAISPDTLRGLVAEAIERHIDWSGWDACVDREAKESAELRQLIEALDTG